MVRPWVQNVEHTHRVPLAPKTVNLMPERTCQGGLRLLETPPAGYQVPGARSLRGEQPLPRSQLQSRVGAEIFLPGEGSHRAHGSTYSWRKDFIETRRTSNQKVSWRRERRPSKALGRRYMAISRILWLPQQLKTALFGLSVFWILIDLEYYYNYIPYFSYSEI